VTYIGILNMSFLELKLLGGLSISQDGVPLLDFKSQKGQALLCYLAVSHKRHTRSALAGLFWMDMPETDALMNLRKVLNRIKPLSPFLLITRETLAFNSNSYHRLDIDEFRTATTVTSDVRSLEYAASLYQGDFLDGFSCDGSIPFEDWASVQRARLRETAVGCLHQLVKIFREQKDYPAAVLYQQKLLAIEPWQEEAHRELMRLLAISDHRSAALLQYETCRSILASEMGIIPDDETVQLSVQIRTGHLKGNSSRNRESDIHYGIPYPNNLPAQTTPFIGRESELAILEGYLANPDIRLITILGPGGIGKTRLALSAAQAQVLGQPNSDQFPQGVYFISLAGLATPDLLVSTIAEAISMRFVEGEEPRKQLLHFLRQKEILLVLDNYEHLLAGTSLMDEILRTSPKIKLLITSREKLNRQAEYLISLGGMTCPPKDLASGSSLYQWGQYNAIQLFIQSARRVRPGFSLTVENQQCIAGICRLLEGMPLGIVLAASLTELLRPQEIVEEMGRDLDFLKTELADVPDRQRSLRAAFTHSWRRLLENDRTIFRQLSVFRSGFSHQAAQSVVSASIQDLQALVNKSLLSISTEGRYTVHELLRQYAAEELAKYPQEEASVLRRHSACYSAFLSEHAQDWHNSRQMENLAEVAFETDNVQVAWSWAVEHVDWRLLLQAIDSWGWYHEWRGRFADGEAVWKAICEKAAWHLEKGKKPDVDGLRLWAKALAWSGRFTAAHTTALQYLQKSLAILEKLDLAGQDTRLDKAFVLFTMADHYVGLDRKKARDLLEPSLALYQELRIPWGISASLAELGRLDWGTGSYPSAVENTQAGLSIQQKSGDLRGQVRSMDNLSWIYKHLGRLGEAEVLSRKALDLSRQLNDGILLIENMADLAFVLWWQGQFLEMLQWAENSLKVCLEYGHQGLEGYARLAVSLSRLSLGQYEQAQSEADLSLECVREANADGVEATVHYCLGCLALVRNANREAQEEFTESQRLYLSVGDNMLGFSLIGLGMTGSIFDQLPDACRYFIDALDNALNLHDFVLLWLILPGVSLFLAKIGAVDRAIEIWTLAKKLPLVNSSKWYADTIGMRIEAAARALSSGAIDAATHRGQGLDLWQTAETLINELAAPNHFSSANY
jgi:predicted ATPase/DNA-binding SARP family transcriptional activator